MCKIEAVDQKVWINSEDRGFVDNSKTKGCKLSSESFLKNHLFWMMIKSKTRTVLFATDLSCATALLAEKTALNTFSLKKSSKTEKNLWAYL